MKTMSVVVVGLWMVFGCSGGTASTADESVPSERENAGAGKATRGQSGDVGPGDDSPADDDPADADDDASSSEPDAGAAADDDIGSGAEDSDDDAASSEGDFEPEAAADDDVPSFAPEPDASASEPEPAADDDVEYASEPEPAADDDAPLGDDDTVDAPAVPPEAAAVTNPFVEVAHDPLSTFAVDVDTASYDIFRRDVNAGTLPVPTQVRLEDFVNFFDYDYPAPEAGAEEPFSIELAAAPNLIDNGTTLLRVGIQGELAPTFEKRAANLVFLVDVSGSMLSEEKLPLVKKVLTYTLDVLEPEDTVSIVTYASGTEVRLEPTKVDEAETIRGVIDSLDAGGSTNGAGGIQLAYAQAEAGFIEGGINHVILATDGDFNVGVSDTAGLVELIEEKRLTGVTLTALGFGTSNNDQMMELVSNAGNGVYGVIADEAQAETYVSERLLHNLTFIAKDVKIQVEFNSDQVLAYRLLGYENRAIADQDFRNDVVDAGEIGAGHRVTALYQLVLVGGEVPSPEGAPAALSGAAYDGAVEVAPEDLVLVKVRYKDVDAMVEDPAYEVARTLRPGAIAASYLDLEQDFQWAVAMATFAEVLAGNPYASTFDLDQIQRIVDEQAERDTDRAEFATLFETARQLIDPR
jgi:Ca-activated chloride channel homolog